MRFAAGSAPASFLPTLGVVVNAAFNGLGRPLWSTGFNWTRATLGTIPFAWWGAHYEPVKVTAGQGAGLLIFGRLAMLAAQRLTRSLGAQSQQGWPAFASLASFIANDAHGAGNCIMTLLKALQDQTAVIRAEARELVWNCIVDAPTGVSSRARGKWCVRAPAGPCANWKNVCTAMAPHTKTRSSCGYRSLTRPRCCTRGTGKAFMIIRLLVGVSHIQTI